MAKKRPVLVKQNQLEGCLKCRPGKDGLMMIHEVAGDKQSFFIPIEAMPKILELYMSHCVKKMVANGTDRKR